MLISLEVPGPGPARKLYFILDDSTSHLPFLTVLFWAAFWTSLWARKPLLPLRYLLMQWMTTLIVLVSVSQSACYKRWGSIIIRCCMSPSLVLTSSSLRFWPVLYRIMIRLITFPLWLFILSAVNIVMPLHAAIIVSTFSLHSCFSSCLLITGRQPEKITPPRYLGQKHRNTATREASRESVDLTLEWNHVRYLLHMQVQLLVVLLVYLVHARLLLF